MDREANLLHPNCAGDVEVHGGDQTCDSIQSEHLGSI